MKFSTATVLKMPDVQSDIDARCIPIQRVGIRDVRHPLVLQVSADKTQSTIANWTLTVALPAEEKGTHMSRFIALLDKYQSTPFTPVLFQAMAQEMLFSLQAQRGDITALFPYFMTKTAPVSKVQSLLDYVVQWIARVDSHHVEFEWIVQVPVTSLCPCSRAISEYGAHNQRSHVTVSVVSNNTLCLDDLIRLIEKEASCELWGLLKRPDEKYVTEQAYNNPKFVEDVVRDVALQISILPGVVRYRVEVENFESIHNHSAYAVVESNG